MKFQYDCRNKCENLNDQFINQLIIQAQSLKLRHKPVLLELNKSAATLP